MFTVRPAFPRFIYLFGAFAAVVLIGLKVSGSAGTERIAAPPASLAGSPQILALEIQK